MALVAPVTLSRADRFKLAEAVAPKMILVASIIAGALSVRSGLDLHLATLLGFHVWAVQSLVYGLWSVNEAIGTALEAMRTKDTDR